MLLLWLLQSLSHINRMQEETILQAVVGFALGVVVQTLSRFTVHSWLPSGGTSRRWRGQQFSSHQTLLVVVVCWTSHSHIHFSFWFTFCSSCFYCGLFCFSHECLCLALTSVSSFTFIRFLFANGHLRNNFNSQTEKTTTILLRASSAFSQRTLTQSLPRLPWLTFSLFTLLLLLPWCTSLRSTRQARIH